MFADGSYANAEEFEQLEGEGNLYVVLSAADELGRRYDFRPQQVKRPGRVPSENGERLHARRKHTAELVLGIAKKAMGLS